MIPHPHRRRKEKPAGYAAGVDLAEHVRVVPVRVHRSEHEIGIPKHREVVRRYSENVRQLGQPLVLELATDGLEIDWWGGIVAAAVAVAAVASVRRVIPPRMRPPPHLGRGMEGVDGLMTEPPTIPWTMYARIVPSRQALLVGHVDDPAVGAVVARTEAPAPVKPASVRPLGSRGGGGVNELPPPPRR